MAANYIQNSDYRKFLTLCMLRLSYRKTMHAATCVLQLLRLEPRGKETSSTDYKVYLLYIDATTATASVDFFQTIDPCVNTDR